MGLALFERHRYEKNNAPSLSRLLLLAEVELLKTIKAELKRRRGRERRLVKIEDELRELNEDEAHTNI
ncbi:MAG: hypothetical protein DRN83_00950 [Hadesarchaea archaeon]|nr:MAG: hypothetical protein DRN83_00950 [Hadesarchaea archaeon]